MTLTTKGRVRDPLNRLYFNGSGLRTDESTENSREPAARGEDQFGLVGQRAAHAARKGEQIWTVSPSKTRRDDEVALGRDRVEGGDGGAVSAEESS